MRPLCRRRGDGGCARTGAARGGRSPGHWTTGSGLSSHSASPMRSKSETVKNVIGNACLLSLFAIVRAPLCRLSNESSKVAKQLIKDRDDAGKPCADMPSAGRCLDVCGDVLCRYVLSNLLPKLAYRRDAHVNWFQNRRDGLSNHPWPLLALYGSHSHRLRPSRRRASQTSPSTRLPLMSVLDPTTNL